MFPIVFLVLVGMWFERFVIIVTSLHRDYLPSSWRDYAPTWVDMSMLLGSFGFFFTLVLLFVRFAPVIAVAELKSALQPHPKSIRLLPRKLAGKKGERDAG